MQHEGVTCKSDAGGHMSSRLLFHPSFISITIRVERTGSFHGIISVECNFLLDGQHGQNVMGTSVTDACESGQLKDNVRLSAGGSFRCLTETSYLSVRPSDALDI